MNPLSLSVNLWRNLTGSQKTAFIIAVVLVGALVTIAVSLANATNYAPLYTTLSDTDKAIVVDKLKAAKIDYRLTGSTVEIPQGKIDEFRMTLAGEGIPKESTDGWSLFDKPQFGTSEFTERINQMRAQQGELEKSICTIRSVATARVHLALPEHSLYAQDSRAVTASVVLGLRDPMPSAKEVRAITHLVSSAVTGLDPENVSIVDTNGNLLSEMVGLNGENGDTRLQAQRDAETQIETKVQSTLDRVLGPDKSMVRVSAQMDFDKSTIESETYSPIGSMPANQQNGTVPASGTAPTTAAAGATPTEAPTGVLESTQTSSETYGGGKLTASGTPGLTTNSTGANGTDGKTGYVRKDSTSQYRISKQVEHIERTPGRIGEIRVALFVDESIPAEQANLLPATVAAAAGTTRELVSMQTIPFDTSVAKSAAMAEKKEASSALWGNVTRIALSVLLVLGFMGLLITIYRRSVLSPATLTPIPLEGAPYQVLASPNRAVDQYAATAALPGESSTPDLQLDPKRVAEVIQGLLKEDA